MSVASHIRGIVRAWRDGRILEQYREERDRSERYRKASWFFYGQGAGVVGWAFLGDQYFSEGQLVAIVVGVLVCGILGVTLGVKADEERGSDAARVVAEFLVELHRRD